MNVGPPASSPTSHQAESHAADCVLVHPAGSEPSTELKEALAKHRIAVHRATSPFDALARLCMLTRRAKTRPTILLLAHPARLDRPDELFKLSERFAPQATRWMFDAAGSPRLRAATAADATTWAKPSTPVAPPTLEAAAPPVPPQISFAGPGFARPLIPAEPSGPSTRVEPKPSAAPAQSPPQALKLAGAPNQPATTRVPITPPALDTAKTDQNTNKVSSAKRGQAPGPKFVGGSWDGGVSPFPGMGPGATPRQLLTDEELEMLLADRPTRPQN